MRVKTTAGEIHLVTSGLTDADLEKKMARGFRIQAQTRGSLARTFKLQPPYGPIFGPGPRAVRRINAEAMVDFNSYYYTDAEISPRAWTQKHLASQFMHNRATVSVCFLLNAQSLVSGSRHQRKSLKLQARNMRSSGGLTHSVSF